MIPETLQKWFRSLRGKTTVLALILAVVPLFFAGNFIFFQGKEVLWQGATDKLTGIAHLRVQVVNNWFRQAEQGIEIAAIALRGDAALRGSGKEMELYEYQTLRIREELEKIVEENDLFSELFLLGLDGEILISTDEDNEGKLRANRPYFSEGQKRTFVQNMYYSLTLEATASTIATPVFDYHDRVVAVLAGRIRLSTLNPLLLDRAGMGETGDTYLVNKNNFYATDPRFAQGVAMKKAVYTTGVVRCLSHKGEGIAEYPDYRGEPVLGVHIWMPEREMCLIAEESQEETLAPILRFRKYIALSFFIAFVFGLLLALRFARQLTRPITEILSGVTQIQSGKLHHRVVVKNKDELGILAESFNDMSSGLARSRDELINAKNYVDDILRTMSDALIVVNPHTFSIETVNPAGEKLLGCEENALNGKLLLTLFKNDEEISDFNERYRTIVENARILCLETDARGQVKRVNQVARRFFGVSENEYQKINITKLLDTKLSSASLRVLSGGDAELYENPDYPSVFGHKENFHFGGHIRPLFNEHGNARGSTLLFIDLDPLSEQERENWLERIQTIEHQSLLDPIADQGLENREYQLLKADGTAVDTLLSAGFMRGARNELQAVVIVAKDITELKDAQSQLIHAAKLASLGEMTSSIAHELKQPLSVIELCSSNAIESLTEDQEIPEALEDLGMVRKNVKRGAAIIQRMRVFSRKEGAPRQPAPIAEMIDESLILLAKSLQEQNIEVIRDVSEKLPAVLCDSIQIEQVLTNLIANARDAFENVPPEQQRQLTIRAFRKEERVAIEIEDNAGGIPEDALPHIFDSFFTTKESGMGTGLGLSISNTIVENHGGALTVENHSGKGAVFRLTLPV